MSANGKEIGPTIGALFPAAPKEIGQAVRAQTREHARGRVKRALWTMMERRVDVTLPQLLETPLGKFLGSAYAKLEALQEYIDTDDDFPLREAHEITSIHEPYQEVEFLNWHIRLDFHIELRLSLGEVELECRGGQVQRAKLGPITTDGSLRCKVTVQKIAAWISYDIPQQEVEFPKFPAVLDFVPAIPIPRITASPAPAASVER